LKAFFKYKVWLIFALIVFVVFPLIWLSVLRFEGSPPVISVVPSIVAMGKSQQLNFTVDDKSGIRKIRVSLVQDGKEKVLVEEELPSSGFGRTGAIRRKSFELILAPKKLGFKDGRSILQMTAWDYSWRNWWRGNREYIEKPVLIDTKSPGIDVLTPRTYVNQGGCGLVIYSLSEDCPDTGVAVGENFFPGYAGYFDDDSIYMAFFAVNHDQGPGTKIYIRSTDRAGNSARSGFSHKIRKKTFKKDRLTVSDGFLDMKMPEFEVDVPGNAAPPNLEKYIYVNRHLRAANYMEITGITANAEDTMLWEGPFLRFPNSAPRAAYADFRKYYYNGKKIDEQVHMGIDLASLARSAVPAGNNGKVVFADDLGIYGKTVLIDHGYGLFSMYSHLSHIGSDVGQTVARGDTIGKSGITGLAAGDHLHYAVMLHNTFVNPIEWWDGHWIKDNITQKIEMVKSGPEQ
jgi:murein DD-endopeptidase MepM/ murein hydrolase activator NlpD